MWFSERQIIPNLQKLRSSLGDNSAFFVSVPNNDFEYALISGTTEFAIVCHPPVNPEIEHRQIAQEKWIIIAPASWQKALQPGRTW